MDIIGCDLHSSYQGVAWVNPETGAIMPRRLEHENGEARTFYARRPRGTVVGIEATFPALWFERSSRAWRLGPGRAVRGLQGRR